MKILQWLGWENKTGMRNWLYGNNVVVENIHSDVPFTSTCLHENLYIYNFFVIKNTFFSAMSNNSHQIIFVLDIKTNFVKNKTILLNK